ncbi:O-antigen ligase family protein [Sporohalobacter salinus]|uniref:O-antigen ligase family protein n=1 Tax=Sporohalobacter salinus TaxID=1494606 RepID=UPI001961277F|nr:O-antigen ligase family protein [Sporohalobacter salinus]MBM7622956.1 O-antigen ligase [Sporohalobacter salinus]
MKLNKLDSILNMVMIVGFVVYALGATNSLGVMNTGLGIAFLAWIIKKIKNFNFKVKSTPYDKYIIFFLLAVLFSFIDSWNLARSIDRFQRYIIPIILFYMLVDLEPDLKMIKRLLGSLFIGMLGSICYGLWQYHLGIRRISSTLFVMEFADLLSFTAIYTIIYGIWGKIKTRSKLFWLLISIILVISLIFTRTRGVWVAFIISLGIILILKERRYFIYFLIGMILFFAIAPYFIPKTYVNRFVSIFNLQTNKSNVTRINLWKGALAIYRNHFINGIGLDNFETAIRMDRYLYKPVLSKASAHNNFLQLAAETGSFGVISFVLLFGVILKQLYTYYRLEKNNNFKLLFLSTIGLVVSYLVHGLTEYNLNDRFVGRVVWFMLAISLLLGKRTDKERIDCEYADN